ncbi:MAG: methyltransferase domain-containing protein [Candidatus Thermoplasmatota archaeon]
MKTKVEKCHDIIAERYDSDLDKDLYMRLYEDITWDNIKRYLPKNKNAILLDAGGGTGRWAVRIAQLGYNVILTDISDGMLRVAERKIKKLKLVNKIKIIRADIRDMRMFYDEMFDFVLCEGDPLSYCRNYRKAFKELVRVLKREGKIIVSVDNKTAGLRYLIKQKKFNKIENFLRTGNITQYDKRAKVGFPVHTFTPQELKSLFESNDLKVLRLIGKPVIPASVISEMLKNNRVYKKILEINVRLADKLDYISFAGHLEIVGLKC